MGKMKEIYTDITQRLEDEVKQGFDSADEMKEVFLEIADEFGVSPDDVWTLFNCGDFDLDYDPGDLELDMEYYG